MESGIKGTVLSVTAAVHLRPYSRKAPHPARGEDGYTYGSTYVAPFSAAGRLHQQPAAETLFHPKALQPRLRVAQAFAFDATPLGRTVMALDFGKLKRLQLRYVRLAVLEEPRQDAEGERFQINFHP